MRYDISKLPLQALLQPVSQAGAVLVRLDERIAGSPAGPGWTERMHFADACASLWVDGELVQLEDLVLHDAGHDVRAPTHALTIARDVLTARRRIAGYPPGWALSADGLGRLRGQGGTGADETGRGLAPTALAAASGEGGQARAPDGADALDAELAAIDAVLARATAAIDEARAPGRRVGRERSPLLYDLDWDEDERLEAWREVLEETSGLPAALRAVIVLDAWNSLDVLQHAPWLGRQLAAAVLRQAGLTTSAHLAAVNIGLRSIPIERRRHPGRNTRLLALLNGLIAAAELGLKEHDRLALARQVMERRLAGRRASSKLPDLIDLVMARPLVSAGMVATALDVTPRAALRIVQELDLREMTGRGRFRAWGVL
jgi:hypothetical protein